MRILKLPAKILYYVSDEFNKICKNVFLCVSIQIAARISTGKSDMAIAHCWICLFALKTYGKTIKSCWADQLPSIMVCVCESAGGK